jgi:hypothetical protein
VLGGAVGGHAHRRAGAGEREPEKTEKGRPVSEGTQGQQGNENYSLSDSNSTTVENDKSPKGPLATLLNLDILPSLVSDTTILESGDGEDYSGQEGGGPGGSGQG